VISDSLDELVLWLCVDDIVVKITGCQLHLSCVFFRGPRDFIVHNSGDYWCSGIMLRFELLYCFHRRFKAFQTSRIFSLSSFPFALLSSSFILSILLIHYHTSRPIARTNNNIKSRQWHLPAQVIATTLQATGALLTQTAEKLTLFRHDRRRS
jgi:hypothetical protein